MATFRLGTQLPSSAESGLVRALLKLLSGDQDANLNWSYAEEAPYDALVVDSVSFSVYGNAQHTPAQAVLVLTDQDDMAGAAPDTLARPIRAEQLRSWLLDAQKRISTRAGSPGSQLDQAHDPTATPTAHSVRFTQGHQFKLHRWPPTALMQKDLRRVRMATLLSKRFVTLGELMDISQETEDRCNAFLNLLQGFGLLDVQMSASSAASVPTPPEREITPVHANSDKNRRQGLVSSIRRRLGL